MALTECLIQSIDGLTTFSFDAEVREKKSGGSTIAKHPVESGQPLTPYQSTAPIGYDLEGVITYSPQTGVPGAVRAGDEVEKLYTLQAKLEPVLFFCELWAGQVWVEKADATRSRDGKKIDVSVSLTTYRSYTPGLTSMPASRLKAAVKPGASPAPASASGGKQSTAALDGYNLLKKGMSLFGV